MAKKRELRVALSGYHNGQTVIPFVTAHAFPWASPYYGCEARRPPGRTGDLLNPHTRACYGRPVLSQSEREENMTQKQFANLPVGTTVRWDTGLIQGKIKRGRVPMFGGGVTDPVRHIAWFVNGPVSY